jgi:hypothetical protein
MDIREESSAKHSEESCRSFDSDSNTGKTVDREEQYLKQSFPTFSIDFGMEMDMSEEHERNVSEEILVSPQPDSKTTVVRDSQLSKQCFRIC